jgi:hypothetical protein
VESRRLILLGPAFLATLTLGPVEVSPISVLPGPVKGAVASAFERGVAVPNEPEPKLPGYREGRKEGFQQGLQDAAKYDCKRPVGWRPRAWVERLRDPRERVGGLGHWDGHKEAYDKVCGGYQGSSVLP